MTWFNWSIYIWPLVDSCGRQLGKHLERTVDNQARICICSKLTNKRPAHGVDKQTRHRPMVDKHRDVGHLNYGDVETQLLVCTG